MHGGWALLAREGEAAKWAWSTYIEGAAGGDREWAIGLERTFRAYFHEVLIRMESALVQNDASELARLAHKLRGSALCFGETLLISGCGLLIKAVEAGSQPAIRESLEELHHYFQSFRPSFLNR